MISVKKGNQLFNEPLEIALGNTYFENVVYLT